MERPLGSIEEGLAVVDRNQPFMMVAVLRLQGTLKISRLQSALAYLQKRHPMLRMRIVKEHNRISFMDDTFPPLAAEVIEHAEASDWLYAAENAANTPMDVVAGELLRCVYLPGEAESDLILVAHHAIVDMQSLTTLFHELLTFCTQEDYAAFPIFSKMPPPSDALLRSGKSATARNLPSLARTVVEGIRDRGSQSGQKGYADEAASACKLVTLDIPATDIDPLIRSSQNWNIFLESVVQAAMILAIYSHFHEGKSVQERTFAFTEMRSQLEPFPADETIACYTAVVSSSLKITSNTELWELAQRIEAALEKESKDESSTAASSGKNLGMMMRPGAIQPGTTALTCDSFAGLNEQYGSIRVGGLHRFIVNRFPGALWMMRAGLRDDRLTLDAAIQEHHFSREDAESMLAAIRHILMKA